MRNILTWKNLALVCVSAFLMAAVGAAGTHVFRVRTSQTTANTLIADFRNGANASKASIDIEGDLVVAGSVTAGGTVSASGTELEVPSINVPDGGVTIEAGDLLVTAGDVTVTAGALAVGGTSTLTGAVAANGGFSVDSPAFVVANTTGALTTTGAMAANGGFSVDSPAFVIADTTGAITTTGLANLNGGLAVDTSNFTVSGTTGAVVTASTIAATGAISGPRTIVTAASGTTALTAAQSGALVYNTGTSGTTTFTLPTAAAGLHFCFAELGDAAGELLVNPFSAADDVIVGKIHGAEDASGIATAANTGIKNTAGTNVKGDFVCLTAVDATTWAMTAVAGVWASQ